MSLTSENIALLEHIYDESGRDTTAEVDLWSTFDRSTHEASAYHLTAVGLATIPSYSGKYCITPLGMNYISNLKERRRNGPARMAACRLGLILWLYDHYVEGSYPQSTEELVSSDRGLYLGRPFGEKDVTRSVEYLLAAGLIEGITVAQSDHLLRPTLTPKGADCAESEKSVSEFLNPPTPNGPTFNVKVDGSQNVIVGTQKDFTQNNNSGIDPSVLAQVAHFAGAARQGAPTYGLEEGQRIEVEQIADALEAEATGDAPDRGRLRQLADRLVVALSPAAGSALGSMVVALGEQAVAAISG